MRKSVSLLFHIVDLGRPLRGRLSTALEDISLSANRSIQPVTYIRCNKNGNLSWSLRSILFRASRRPIIGVVCIGLSGCFSSHRYQETPPVSSQNSHRHRYHGMSLSHTLQCIPNHLYSSLSNHSTCQQGGYALGHSAVAGWLILIEQLPSFLILAGFDFLTLIGLIVIVIVSGKPLWSLKCSTLPPLPSSDDLAMNVDRNTTAGRMTQTHERYPGIKLDYVDFVEAGKELCTRTKALVGINVTLW